VVNLTNVDDKEELAKTLATLMKAAVIAAKVYNGIGAVFRLFGYAVPKVRERA
jgi:hypothetical protein